MSTVVLQTTQLCKSYTEGERQFHALNQVNLSIQKGEFVAVMGPSGSGKSTLLHLLSGLDRPTSGQVLLNGADLYEGSESQITHKRRGGIGFVFQMFNLIHVLTALENVKLPFLLAGKNDQNISQRAFELLELVGIGHLASSYPSQMSGGQQQRVAIARALVTRPSILLADEPTGSLDSQTGKDILAILRGFCNTTGQSLVMATHDAGVASHAHHVLFMKDGRLVEHLDLTDDWKHNLGQITKKLEGIII